MADLARDQGCRGMWVLTDEDDDAAMRTYAAAGGGYILAPSSSHATAAALEDGSPRDYSLGFSDAD